MSRSKSSAAVADDIWTKLQKGATVATSSEPASSESVPDELAGSSIVFVGDLGSGKSTLIQSFLKPSGAKETKPTIALEYNYARRSANGSKSVANLWEIGGDLVEPRLMEIGLTVRNLPVAAVVISIDLSKPHNVLNSLLRCISAVKEVAAKRVAELQATNVNLLGEMREKSGGVYKGHPDENRVRPSDVTLCVVGSKGDLFKSLPSADRRAVVQVLRFVAHFFGAHLVTHSNSDSHTRDALRQLLSSLAFGAPVKAGCESNPDKPLYITRGRDNFEGLLGVGEDSVGVKDVRGLCSSSADFASYITHKGVTRDCWSK
jgi:dynein light intermediate chain 2